MAENGAAAKQRSSCQKCAECCCRNGCSASTGDTWRTIIFMFASVTRGLHEEIDAREIILGVNSSELSVCLRHSQMHYLKSLNRQEHRLTRSHRYSPQTDY